MKNLTYKVPRQAYLELLADMTRKNDRRPVRLITGLLLTVGQMAAVAWLCLFRLEPGQRSFFLIWSVLLAALTVLRRCTVRQRAKGTLQRLEYTGQLSEDFWKEHQLRIADGELRLRYGGQSLSCPLYGISRVDERADVLYLYSGEVMFDIVPRAAFSGEKAMYDWAEDLRKAAASAKAPEKAAPEDAGEGFAWTMEADAFEKGQYQAYRLLYYRYRFLRPATFVRLAVSAAAAASLTRYHAPVNVALCGALLALANLENISMIPPLCRLRIRRELGDWRGGHAYRLALRKGTLIFSSDRARTELPVERIILCREWGDWYFIIWNNFPAVVLPKEAAREAAPLLQQIQALHQGHLRREHS